MNYLPTDGQENAILHRIARGEAGAVEDCISAYGNLIWALARRLTPRAEDAEDAVQEIFVEIWQSAARFDASRAAEITFISMLARRRLIDRLRRSYRQPGVQSIDDLTDLRPATFELEANTKIEADRARKALFDLRSEQREMMLLNIFDGMSHGEIAEKTGIPLGTVKTHIRRGFKCVRQMLTGTSENAMA